MIKKIICLFIIVSLQFCLSSCLWDQGSFKDILAMREEFAKYQGKTDVAIESDLGLTLSFHGRRFDISPDEGEDIYPYIYDGELYYYIESPVEGTRNKAQLKLYKIALPLDDSEWTNDYDGMGIKIKGAECIYESELYSYRKSSVYYITNPTPSLVCKHIENKVASWRVYSLATGQVTELYTADFVPFRWDRSEQFEIDVDTATMILTVKNKITNETVEKSLIDMVAEWQVSMDKFDFYCEGAFDYNGRFFVFYTSDMHYDFIYPELIFELDIESMKLSFAGYFEEFNPDVNCVIADPITHD